MLNMTLEIIYKMVKPVSPFENLSLFGEDLNKECVGYPNLKYVPNI